MTRSEDVENARSSSDTPSSLVFYNDNDAYCAQWLRNLGDAGLLPVGFVDERSILNIEPDDLAGYEQCHFFAGIGGWPYALRIAGYERSVWTGSCPCQPFSTAGRQSGSADERHLWPHWLRLIRECRPDTVFGEQVEGAVGFGWVDRVFADLEAEGYACGAAVLGAHSVGAPHIRQRLFWVADARGKRYKPLSGGMATRQRREDGGGDSPSAGFVDHSATGGLGYSTLNGCRQGSALTSGCTKGDCAQGAAERSGSGGRTGGLGDADDTRSQGRNIDVGEHAGQRSPWATGELLPCLDGKARRVEPAIFPLAHGIPNRVGLLRGAGNAIVPQVAAEFVSAFLEIATKSEERTTDE